MAPKPKPPTFYTPHYLCQFGGTLGGGEIWTCSVRMFPAHNGPVSGDPIPKGDLKTLGDRLGRWFADPGNNMAASAALGWVKLNAIGMDGRYMSSVNTNIYDIEDVKGGIGAALPPFVSLAYTWRTDRRRGPGSHGRIYPPNYGLPMDNIDPAWIGAQRQAAVAGSAHRLLSIMTMNEVFQGGLQIDHMIPCVASAVDGSLNIITGVDIGRRFDVQRRRENAIPENYVSKPFNWQSPDNIP